MVLYEFSGADHQVDVIDGRDCFSTEGEGLADAIESDRSGRRWHEI